MKHLHLEIVEATEAAARAVYDFIGSGDKLKIDELATNAMRKSLDSVHMRAEVVIGEGIKDDAAGLFKGDRVGLESRTKSWKSNDGDDTLPPHDSPEWKLCDYDYDIAVDPVDGTTQTAKGGYEAMSIIAVGNKGCLLPAEEFYMEKIAVASTKHRSTSYFQDIDLNFNDSYELLVNKVKHRTGKNNLTVCMLDRPRHQELANQMRSLGCRIRFIQDCDVSGAIAVSMPKSGIDLFIGIGGAPEGVITAAAMKCTGGEFIGRLVDNKTYKPVDDKVYDIESLAKGNVMFAATGITNGSLLRGVRTEGSSIVTHSILMESIGKRIKHIESYHG